MPNGEYNQQVTLYKSPIVSSPTSTDMTGYLSVQKRRRRAVRSQRSIQLAILEACRTPTVQHWIMVKARLGYDTFWKHMNILASSGMIVTSSDGYKTLYSVNQKGLVFLEELETTQV
jgi:predicted transcriptional regulator